jgi:hypothetical protein
MKIDALTGGAIAFAGFAAWYVLRKPTTDTGNANVNTLFTMNKSQRDEVGGALAQNTAAVNQSLGLKPPASGFWNF